MNLRNLGVLCGVWALCGLAQAFGLASVSPQGEVAQVNQVVLSFDEAATRFGDASASAPANIECSDATAEQGSGRWLNERRWVFDFAADLPPGVACSIQIKPGIKSASGALLTGATSYKFNSGGPFVQRHWPDTSTPLDEDQYFILQLSGPATQASVQTHLWCAVPDLGERVAVRMIDGKERAALLKAQGLDKQAASSPLSFVTLACNRRLTPGSKIQLVFGKGVTTPGSAALPKGVANALERRFDFQVRQPFTANLSCERENAQAACLPIRPLRLSFSAPVTRAQLQGIKLSAGKQTLPPTFSPPEGSADAVLSQVTFQGIFPELASLTLTLPKGFADASGRPLQDADSFPMTINTGAMPPLAKFAAAPFGVIERFAEPDGVAMLPVTLRNVEADLQLKALDPVPPAAKVPAGQVRDLMPQTDADIIAWYRKVQSYDGYGVSRKLAARDVLGPLPKVLPDEDKAWVQPRMLSLLQGQAGVKTLNLPQPASSDPRPFEVVGIPLTPGFHVLEISSQKLGSSLLDARHGAARTMVVRTSALVTNLGVHFKLGRENALAWVTTLDKGQPVTGARVQVSDCHGKALASASTNAQGIAYLSGLSPKAPVCSDEGNSSEAYFVSARAMQAGVADMAFTWSDWNRGIEPWRFHLPTSTQVLPDERVHTIFDRTLLRAGETVSMKHILRVETASGFGLPAQPLAYQVITHVGSGQQYTQPLVWRKTATGGLSAESSFAIPPAAKLGEYEVRLGTLDYSHSLPSGSFRVAEFRLPGAGQLCGGRRCQQPAGAGVGACPPQNA